MGRRNITYDFTVARQKSTQKLLMIFYEKTANNFSVFQFHIRRTQQKSASSSKFTLDYHNSITQNQPYSKIRLLLTKLRICKSGIISFFDNFKVLIKTTI